MSGLLIHGKLVQVPGLEIISPNQYPWAKLDSRDYAKRSTSWVRQITLHTTKGKWPQHVKPGAGKGGRDKVVADFWRKDPNHSAAQIVVDNDGSIVCLCDLGRFAAFHNSSRANHWAIGIEIYQEADGGIYEAALDATVKLVLALCDLFGIPFQGPKKPYRNAPMKRLERHDPTMVGVFGHRDITHNRGKGDPGEEIWARLRASGLLCLDFDAYEDKDFWEPIQKAHGLDADGVCGPGTVRALRSAGMWHSGIFVEAPL